MAGVKMFKKDYEERAISSAVNLRPESAKKGSLTRTMDSVNFAQKQMRFSSQTSTFKRAD
jgi:hypothetical protein